MNYTPGGMGKQGQPNPLAQPLNVDASTLDTFYCKNCNNYLFQDMVIVKKISALNPVNTTGQEMLVPVHVLSCTNCGYIPEEFGGKTVPKTEENNE